MKQILVGDIMTRDPIVVNSNINLEQCAETMIKKKVSSLPILEGKRLVGYISQHDILWAIIKKRKQKLQEIKAVDICPKKIATISPTATLKDALEKIKETKFERLPVIQEGNFIGIITLKDILSFKPEFYPELEEIYKIREEAEKIKRLKHSHVSEGICEECGNRNFLVRSKGMLVCESCMNS